MRRTCTRSSVCVVLASCSGGDPVATSQMQITTIDIYDFYYSPTATTVRAGTTVEWVNHGPSAHTATSDDGVWDSGSIARPVGRRWHAATWHAPTSAAAEPVCPQPQCRGTTFSTIFNTPGVYGFHCSLHPPATNPNFVGTITVTE